MKKLFFLGIMGFAVIWGLGFFLWRIFLSFVDIYDDWQLSKELREIERESEVRRRQQDDDRGAEKQRLQREGQSLETAPADDLPADDDVVDIPD